MEQASCGSVSCHSKSFFNMDLTMHRLRLLHFTFLALILSDSFLAAQSPVVEPPEKKQDRPSIFDGLRRMIGDVPAFDDNEATDGLVESLNQAEQLYDEIRQSNRAAIRGINRQVRIGQAKRSPNIILITVPQLRFDQLPVMPRLNGVRTSGITFTNYYAPADNLRDSRWSTYSGKLAAQAPESGKLSRKESLAELMWKAGYETAVIGTWATTQHPVEIGYEHWTGFPTSTGTVARYPEFFYAQSAKAKIVGASKKSPDAIRLLTNEVHSYIDENKNSTRQFYLHVALPFLEGDDSNQNAEHLDHAIGSIIDKINSSGIAGRLCLLIAGETSHHIAADVEKKLPVVDAKLTYSKSGMHEGNLRTPLIVFWGNRTKHGSVSRFPCTGVDLQPTFLNLALAQKKPIGLPGVSLQNELLGNETRLERILYWRMKDGSQAARRGRWKVIVPAETKKIQLYDLELDPSETKDVAAEYPDIVKSFIVKSKPAKQSTEASL